MKKWLNVVKIGITLLFVMILIYTIDVKEIVSLYKSMSLKIVMLCICAYMGINILRTYRFFVLFEKPCSIVKLLPVILIHGMYNRVLPLKIGEGVLPYLMSKDCQIEIRESVLSLLIVRVFDVLSAIVFFVLSYSLYKQIQYMYIILLVVLLVVTCTLVLPVSYYIWGKIRTRQNRLLNWNVIVKLDNLIIDQKKKFAIIKSFKILIISLLAWVMMFYVFQQVLLELGMSFTCTEIYMAGSASNISSIIPASALGNFGTMEMGWSGIMIMLGYSETMAFTSGFCANLFTFSCSLLLGVLCVIYRKIRFRKGAADDR